MRGVGVVDAPPRKRDGILVFLFVAASSRKEWMGGRTYLVDTESGIVSQNRGHIRQKQPAIFGPRDRRFLLGKDRTTTFLNCKGPDQDPNPGHRNQDGLDGEQPPQLIGMHAQKGELNDPKDQKGHHSRGRDPLRCRDGIFHIQITGPNGPDHHSHRIPSVDILNGKPKHGENQPGDDRDI